MKHKKLSEMIMADLSWWWRRSMLGRILLVPLVVFTVPLWIVFGLVDIVGYIDDKTRVE